MPDDLVQQTKALQGMDVAQLREKYREVLGEEAISRNKRVLIERIRRRLVEQDSQEKREQQQPEGGMVKNDIIHRLHVLRNMSLEDLRAEHEKVFGTPSQSRNRKQLFAKIAKRLQVESLRSQPETGAPKPTLTAKFEPKRKGRSKNVTKSTGGEKKPGAKSEKRSRVRPVGARDPRLPKPGTTIERTYKGKKLLVTVEAEGFTFGGKHYRSLSALAKHITGSAAINGFLFFKLGDYAKLLRLGVKEKSGQ